MKFNSALSVLSISLFFSSISFAVKPVPVLCPDVNSIKSEGFAFVEEFGSNEYMGFTMSNYNTDISWFFGLGLVKAQNKDLALDELNQKLSTMSGNPVPEKVKDDQYTCVYQLEDDRYAAMAFDSTDRFELYRLLHK